MSGYRLIDKRRKNIKGGGQAIIINNNIHSQEVPLNYEEGVAAIIRINKSIGCLIIGAYLSQQNIMDNDKEIITIQRKIKNLAMEVNNLMSKYDSLNYIIGGDFNKNEKDVEKLFKSIIEKKKLIRIPNNATHENNIIDHIILPNNINNVEVISTTLQTDHKAITVELILNGSIERKKLTIYDKKMSEKLIIENINSNSFININYRIQYRNMIIKNKKQYLSKNYQNFLDQINKFFKTNTNSKTIKDEVNNLMKNNWNKL